MAVLVDVAAVRGTGRRVGHPEQHLGASLARAHDEMRVAGVEAERDPPVGPWGAGPAIIQSPTRAHS